jgi:hypothetical protein
MLFPPILSGSPKLVPLNQPKISQLLDLIPTQALYHRLRQKQIPHPAKTPTTFIASLLIATLLLIAIWRRITPVAPRFAFTAVVVFVLLFQIRKRK